MSRLNWGPNPAGLTKLAAVAALLVLSLFAQAAFAQQPLSLFKNYFVTGDYVVAGWANKQIDPNRPGYAVGTVNLPDTNTVPSTGVPAGAQIVGAYLYWATVEDSNTS